jgi:hypothetical protein
MSFSSFKIWFIENWFLYFFFIFLSIGLSWLLFLQFHHLWVFFYQILSLFFLLLTFFLL